MGRWRGHGRRFDSVSACEPTGHRWRVLDQLAGQRGLALVCVQPLLVYPFVFVFTPSVRPL